jgi:hypothetical protein
VKKICDGITVMGGAYSGVQARFKAKYDNGKYVDCAAHYLNLVLCAHQLKKRSFFFN